MSNQNLPPPQLADRLAPLPAPAALATPSLWEAKRTLLSRELENHLTPLVDYLNALSEDDYLSLPEFQRAQQLRQAVEALLRYDAATEKLLDYYRRGLALAQHYAARRVPTLEQALGLPIPLPPAC